MKHRIAIIGFGTVGQGFAEILEEKREWLNQRYGLYFDVTAIYSPTKGSIYNEVGLDLKQILSLVRQDFSLGTYSDGIKGWDSLQTITFTNANLIVEVTPTNIKTGEPGITH